MQMMNPMVGPGLYIDLYLVKIYEKTVRALQNRFHTSNLLLDLGLSHCEVSTAVQGFHSWRKHPNTKIYQIISPLSTMVAYLIYIILTRKQCAVLHNLFSKYIHLCLLWVFLVYQCGSFAWRPHPSTGITCHWTHNLFFGNHQIPFIRKGKKGLSNHAWLYNGSANSVSSHQTVNICDIGVWRVT